MPPQQSAEPMGVPAPGLPVPYVTAWSGEELPHDVHFRYHPEAAGLRLTYRNPHPDDWRYGVLRARHLLHRGGRPEWTRVNTYRQWRCMDRLLCRVCAEPARDPATRRIWWLLASQDGGEAEKGYTNAPPTCRSCIPAAIGACPKLRAGAAVYTVGSCRLWAVLGDEFVLGGNGAELVGRNELVLLEEFRRLNRVLAKQLVVTIDDLRREDIP
jgi:hypothetical protein